MTETELFLPTDDVIDGLTNNQTILHIFIRIGNHVGKKHQPSYAIFYPFSTRSKMLIQEDEGFVYAEKKGKKRQENIFE